MIFFDIDWSFETSFTVALLNTYLYDAMTNIFHLLWSKKFYEQLADGVLQKRILREAH